MCVLTNLPGFSYVAYRLDHQYDAVGNLTNRMLIGITGLSGTVTTRYAYDAMNRLTNVVQLTNGATALPGHPLRTGAATLRPVRRRLHRARPAGSGDQ